MANKGINSMYRHSKTWGALAAAIAMMLLSSGVLWAQEDEKIDEQLNLTTQQKTQLRELRENFSSELAPMKARLKELQGDRKKLENQGASQEDIKAVLEKIADQEIKVTLLINQFKKDYLAVLTPEQRRKLQELKDRK